MLAEGSPHKNSFTKAAIEIKKGSYNLQQKKNTHVYTYTHTHVYTHNSTLPVQQYWTHNNKNSIKM